MPLAIHGGRAPGPRVRARAFARIEDTLSVLDEGTGLTHGGRALGPRIRARAFARIEDTLSVLDEGTGLTHSRQDLAACM